MALQKKDFIEIEYTGTTKEGEIFDSNIKEDLEKSNLNVSAKPFIFSLGEDMFLKSVDEFLIGKDVGEYDLTLPPEKAFGNRDSRFVQLMPMRVFREQRINPVPGFMFNFDGRIGKVLSVSGGRVMVDFNNPVAGKEVTYKIKVLRKVENINEQVKAFIEFLFKKDLPFEVKGDKIMIQAEKGMDKFVELFADKFKGIFGKDLEVKSSDDSSDKDKKASLEKSQ